MRTSRHTLSIAALAVALLLASACGDGRASPGAGAGAPPSGPAASFAPAPGGAPAPPAARIPRLVDVGAGKCIPCKAMAPILDRLRTDFAGRFDVQFVDVWVNPDAGTPYGIRIIPTQIFYSADGIELSRHEGFMSREDILAKWRALGVSF